MTLVTYVYRYERPRRKKKPVALEVPAMVGGPQDHGSSEPLWTA
jgi:hypothetical protein